MLSENYTMSPTKKSGLDKNTNLLTRTVKAPVKTSSTCRKLIFRHCIEFSENTTALQQTLPELIFGILFSTCELLSSLCQTISFHALEFQRAYPLSFLNIFSRFTYNLISISDFMHIYLNLSAGRLSGLQNRSNSTIALHGGWNERFLLGCQLLIPHVLGQKV